MPDLLESDAPAGARERREPIAPWPHTVFLLAVFALWAVYGWMHAHLLTNVMPRGATYIGSIVIECLMVGTAIAGLYHRRQFIAEVLGRVTLRGAALDVVQGFLIYLAGTAVMVAIWMVLKPLHPSYQRDAVQAMVPRTSVELALWMVLSLAAGTCEEFLFRGYLLRQFARWWGSATVAIVVSSVLFGCLHLYEGTGAVVGIGGLGAVYAAIAVRRGNLRSVMVAHFLQDALTGLILHFRHGA